jgi:hypothetical protein
MSKSESHRDITQDPQSKAMISQTNYFQKTRKRYLKKPAYNTESDLFWGVGGGARVLIKRL